VPERSDGHIISPNVDASGAAGERDVGTVIYDDGNGQAGDEATPNVDQRASVSLLEPELHDGSAPSHGRLSPSDEAVPTVTQIVGDRDQREIDRRASLCSENVSLNS